MENLELKETFLKLTTKSHRILPSRYKPSLVFNFFFWVIGQYDTFDSNIWLDCMKYNIDIQDGSFMEIHLNTFQRLKLGSVC